MSSRERVPPRRTDPANGQGAGTSDVPPGGGAPPKRPPPWDRPEAETTSFGDWLRRQREMREITLRDIADRTKISMRYLQAMEDNRFDLLPAPIFAKGFLREYARYVGLSPDEVVNHYLSVQQQALGDEEAKKDQTLSHQNPHRPKPVRSWTYGIFLAAAVFVLIGLVAALAWIADRRRESPDTDSTPPPIAAPPQLSPEPLSEQSNPNRPKAPLEVTLDTTGDCWVEVTVDGKLILAEQRMQGESLPIQAQQSVQIKLGDAGVAEIQVNGAPYPLNGKPGEVRELTIDLETVRQLQEKKEAP
ncbi:MAG TPA: RodZ domain-containing protein [Thermoanaerobaculia bacterium]|nr:RodZ domain-containing protein [Thermoanaerobaculia bacterium]